MTVIPLGPGLPQGSSHLPADLSEPLKRTRARAASAYLVLLRVEVWRADAVATVAVRYLPHLFTPA